MPPQAQRVAAAAVTVTELPLRPQDELECRRCEVHCDKVVYPSACVERACPFLYAYEEFGHTYIGCMQKVYGVEIDLEMLREAEARREGVGSRWRSASARSGPASSAASIPSSTSCRSDARPSRSSLS